VPIEGRPVAATSPLLGDAPWTPVERVVTVPPGATAARVTCFLSMTGAAWFDDVSLEADAGPAWIVVQRGRVTFHELEGDRLTDAQRDQVNADLGRIETELGVPHEAKIAYYKYPDVATKERLSGQGGNAHVGADMSVHAIGPAEPHEVVHLVARSFGAPSSVLLGEGLAVAIAGPWNGKDPDDCVRALRKAGALPPLGKLVDVASFRALGDDVTYPASGSFVRWLLRTRGLDRLKQAYVASDSGETLDAQLVRVYGEPLAALEREWLAGLDAVRP
jgi:hypothetical protein